jgi:hypothetical protein
MAQETVLTLDRMRYLKWASGLVVLCIAAYAWHDPAVKPGGGTWLGYTLGTIGALLILWLLYFGVRKRAYASAHGTLRGWLSAHIYLGLALSIVATLHTGFEFGWNIHTLAYALTIAVIVSGIWGITLYIRQPLLMGNLLDGKTLLQRGQLVKDLDAECRKVSHSLSPEVKRLIEVSANGKIFDRWWQHFSGKNPRCATQESLLKLEQMRDVPSREFEEVCTLQFRRMQQLDRMRNFVRLKTWAEIWLLFHVPLSFALLASLLAHVVSVFFYW